MLKPQRKLWLQDMAADNERIMFLKQCYPLHVNLRRHHQRRRAQLFGDKIHDNQVRGRERDWGQSSERSSDETHGGLRECPPITSTSGLFSQHGYSFSPPPCFGTAASSIDSLSQHY